MPASIILQKLHDEAPADHFTLDWLMSKLHKQSFGLIMLVLAIVAVALGVSVVGGLFASDPGVPDDHRPTRTNLSALDRRPPAADAAAWQRRATRHYNAGISREDGLSALAHSAGHDQACRRLHRHDAERAADIDPDSLEQHPPRACDRP